MGYSIGWDENWKRDVGYGVPAYCDHPDCNEVIDRGLAYVCGADIGGGDRGCGLHFCYKHLRIPVGKNMPDQLCERCYPRIKKPFDAKPDHPEWVEFKETDESWAQWRKERDAAKSDTGAGGG